MDNIVEHWSLTQFIGIEGVIEEAGLAISRRTGASGTGAAQIR